MAYEVEAVAETAVPVTSTQFREERVVEPYRQRAVPVPKTGQPDKGVSAGSEESKEPKTEESVTLSPAAAALARKEQKVRQAEQAIKAKEAALEVERAEIADLKARKAKLANKDYSGIEDLVKYDEYTNYLIDKGNGADPQAEALKKVDERVDSVEKKLQADVDKRYEAAVAERKRAVVDLVKADTSFANFKEFKLTNGEKEISFEDTVVQHILDSWEHENVDLPPDQAAKEVKEILLEKAAQWSQLLKNPEEPVPTEKTLPPLKTGIKTLTNNVTTSDVKKPLKSLHGLSDAERYAEARRRAEEKLKLRG